MKKEKRIKTDRKILPTNRALYIYLGGVPALFWGALSFLGLLLILQSFVAVLFLRGENIVDLKFVCIFSFLAGAVLGTFGLWEAILSNSEKHPIYKRILLSFSITAGICSASLIPLYNFRTLIQTVGFIDLLLAFSLISPIIVGIIQIFKLWLPSKSKTK